MENGSTKSEVRKVVKEKQRTNDENVETEELIIRGVTLVSNIPELTTKFNNIAQKHKKKHRFTGVDSKLSQRPHIKLRSMILCPTIMFVRKFGVLIQKVDFFYLFDVHTHLWPEIIIVDQSVCLVHVWDLPMPLLYLSGVYH